MVLLLIVFSPFLFILVVSLLTLKWRNKWKLIMVFGKKGSGKSTYLVKLAYQHMCKGWNVYSNMPDMMIPGVRVFNTDHIGDFVPPANSLLLCDEVGMVWDNRDYKNFKPAVRDFFKLQRHYKVKVYLASQSYDIDKKLRDLCDSMILSVNVLNVFSIGKTIRRAVTLTDPTSEAESRIAESLKFNPFWNWKYTYIPKWAKYFASFTVPDMPELPFYEIVCSNPSKQIIKMEKQRNKAIRQHVMSEYKKNNKRRKS